MRNENSLKIKNVYEQFVSLKEVLKVFFEINDVFEKTLKYIDTLKIITYN